MTNFVTIEGRALAAAMKLATAVIERRNTIPILGHVKITHDKDGLEIVGTDLDIFVTQRLDVIDGAGDWSICIPASVFYGIARAAGAATVRIEPGSGLDDRYRKEPKIIDVAKITVGEADAFYELQTLPASDMPEPTSGGRADLIDTFTNGMLAATLTKVAYAISTEETRYYLNGIFWDISQGERSFVATDGHRLARCRYDKSDHGPASGRIIPRKVCDFIIRHLIGKDVKIFDTKGGTQIEIVAPGIVVRTKLIDGTYPDYRRVIPKLEQAAYSFEFKRQELLTALAQVGVLASDIGKAVRFCENDGRVAVERKNPDFGSATASTQVKWPSEKTPSFGMNLGYVRQAVTLCQEEITLRMVDAGSPFIITDADEDMTRVLMPMRV